VLSALLRRGDAMLALGDVSAARLFYERAAATGSGRSATALGKTYEREVLAQLGARGVADDAAMAARWYRAALALGDVEARPLLDRIESFHP
jgi:TPR repeat protein